jgi:hypothetical protein
MSKYSVSVRVCCARRLVTPFDGPLKVCWRRSGRPPRYATEAGFGINGRYGYGPLAHFLFFCAKMPSVNRAHFSKTLDRFISALSAVAPHEAYISRPSLVEGQDQTENSTVLQFSSWSGRAGLPRVVKTKAPALKGSPMKRGVCTPRLHHYHPRSRTLLCARLLASSSTAASRSRHTSPVRATTCRSTPSCSSAAVV